MAKNCVLCPICKEEVPKKVVEVYGEYEILRCSICEVEFASPFRQAFPSDYDEAYGKGKESGEEWQRAYEFRKKKEHFTIYDGFMDIYTVLYKILKPIRKKGKLLDAGCGNGYFLRLMRGIGFEVYGFDLSHIAINFAREAHHLENVVACSWEELPEDWRDFSIITAIEVAEHLDKPLEFLSKMRELLSLEGTLIISVPNRERVGEKSLYKIPGNYPPNHLTRWNKKALDFLLRKAGFKKVVVKPLAPPTIALKEQFRFSLAPHNYETPIGRILTKPLSETLGHYIAFFLRHFLWERGAYLLGIGKC